MTSRSIAEVVAFADMNITTEESSQSVVFNICHFNDDTGMTEYDPVSISAKVMIDGVSHYLDSSYISCVSNQTNGTIDVSSDAFGTSTLYTDPVTGEWYNLYVFDGKTYKITGSNAVFDGDTEFTNNDGFNFSFDTKPLNYTADSKIEITYEVEEVVNETSKDISVSVDEDAWKYNSYGTWKNLNVKVNDSVYALSKDSATEAITFNNGDTVKVLAGDSYELWSGTISIDMGNVSISGKEPSGLVWNSTLSYENGGLVFKKIADTSWGGVNAGFYKNVFYSYDFTAKADDNSPISGISITDNTSIPYVDPILSELESGKTYTWGTDNSYTFTRNTGGVIDDGVGVMTCKTDAKGFADMLFPIESITGYEYFGSNVFMSSNLDSRLESATSDYTKSRYAYSNNGLVDIDTENVDADGKKLQATLDSLGVSISLTPEFSDIVLGDSYSLTQVTYLHCNPEVSDMLFLYRKEIAIIKAEVTVEDAKAVAIWLNTHSPK